MRLRRCSGDSPCHAARGPPSFALPEPRPDGERPRAAALASEMRRRCARRDVNALSSSSSWASASVAIAAVASDHPTSEVGSEGAGDGTSDGAPPGGADAPTGTGSASGGVAAGGACEAVTSSASSSPRPADAGADPGRGVSEWRLPVWRIGGVRPEFRCPSPGAIAAGVCESTSGLDGDESKDDDASSPELSNSSRARLMVTLAAPGEAPLRRRCGAERERGVATLPPCAMTGGGLCSGTGLSRDVASPCGRIACCVGVKSA